MIKPGVDVAGIRPELVLAFAIAQPIFAQHGISPAIIAADDGAIDLAADVTLHESKLGHWEMLKDQIALAIGPRFEVIRKDHHLRICLAHFEHP